mgnify:CR=1 FL=1
MEGPGGWCRGRVWKWSILGRDGYYDCTIGGFTDSDCCYVDIERRYMKCGGGSNMLPQFLLNK